MALKVYDQQGNLLESYDLDLGRIVRSSKAVEHPAIEGVDEVWHWETVAEYHNGGKDVRRVIDVPGVMAQEAWVEEVPIQVYIPYTQEELDAIEAEKNKPTDEKRIEQLEQALAAFMGGITSVQ